MNEHTLGTWLEISMDSFGPGSAATKFMEWKIQTSPNGAAEELVVSEMDMAYLLASINAKGNPWQKS